MALRRIECIEIALRQMFCRVLQECGDADPPQLREVRCERDDRNYGIELGARFAVEGQPDRFVAYRVSERDLMMDPDFRYRSRGLGRGFLYDAGVLWSSMYEDHYVERMRRVGQQQAIEAMSRGDMAMAQYRQEMVDQLVQHARSFHRAATDVPYFQTATEVLERQRERFRGLDYTYEIRDEMPESPRISWVNEAARRHAVALDRRMAGALGLDVSATTSTTGEQSGALTMETLQATVRALESSPHHADWRRTFVNERMSELAFFGSTAWFVPGVEVGTKEAQERGLQLLRDNLNPEQRASYDKHKHFDVKGGSSGKTYRIKHGRQMNIEELDAKGNRACGWCFLPQGGLVSGDCMLAQKTALELFETDALKIANRFY